MPRIRKYTDEQLIDAIKNSKSWSSVITILGLKAGGGTYVHLQSLATKLNIPTDHFTGRGWNKGGLPFNTNERPLEDYFNGRPIGSSHLKRRLFKEGLKEKRCELCFITAWNGKDAPLELDHINGIRSDNSLSNLRILCPNCHAQTDTYCGKNIQGAVLERGYRADSKSAGRKSVRVRISSALPCLGCGSPTSSPKQRCKNCRVYPTAIDWPSDQQLIYLVQSGNYTQVSLKLGVSSVSVKKRYMKALERTDK